MYCPHTVSLISYHSGTPYLTILRGVMLQGPEGRAVLQRGDANEDNVTLYIPFSVRAETLGAQAGTDGVSDSAPAFLPSTFLPPKAFAACPDPEKHWTLRAEGESAGRCSFFIKGELAAALSLKEARELCDFVYPIAGYTLHDYGSAPLRHYEVVSKVSSRFYQYS